MTSDPLAPAAAPTGPALGGGVMAGPLAGTMALVTGASSGIGEATAQALSDRGAAVAIVARRAERLQALAGRIEDRGGTVLAIAADIGSQPAAQGAVQRTVAERSSAGSTSSSTTPA